VQLAAASTQQRAPKVAPARQLSPVQQSVPAVQAPIAGEHMQAEAV